MLRAAAGTASAIADRAVDAEAWVLEQYPKRKPPLAFYAQLKMKV
jgi:hypothetical protein